jgi:hypothetical protein
VEYCAELLKMLVLVLVLVLSSPFPLSLMAVALPHSPQDAVCVTPSQSRRTRVRRRRCRGCAGADVGGARAPMRVSGGCVAGPGVDRVLFHSSHPSPIRPTLPTLFLSPFHSIRLSLHILFLPPFHSIRLTLIRRVSGKHRESVRKASGGGGV